MQSCFETGLSKLTVHTRWCICSYTKKWK